MNSIQAMRERRAVKAKEAGDLLNAHPGDKWNGTVAAQVDALHAEVGALDDQIRAHQRQIEQAMDNDDTGKGVQRISESFDANDPKNASRVLLNKWIRQGDNSLNAEEWAVIRNTMSTTTGSEGGFTVPTLVASELYDAMKAFGAMRAVAEIIKTDHGRPLSFPTSDGTAEVGEWIAQNVTATAADPTFGTASLNVFKASSKIVAVPYELLQDSLLDVEKFVRVRLAQRLGRLGNIGFSTGAGTTLPDGIVPKSASGKVGITGQTLSIIYDDVIDLIHSVDPAYRGSGCSFMTNDSLLKVLRKLKDTAGRPLWTPSYDAGIRIAPSMTSKVDGGYQDQTTPIVFDYLMGYPVWVNNDIAVPAANAKSMVFGNLSYYKVRDAMDVQLFRFTDSAYTKLGQVGFLAWARMGGNLMDVNAVKFYQHSAT